MIRILINILSNCAESPVSSDVAVASAYKSFASHAADSTNDFGTDNGASDSFPGAGSQIFSSQSVADRPGK